MRALLLLACALTACSPWPAPILTARWPEPKGLGTFVVEGAPLRPTTLDLIAKNDRVYVLQSLGPGSTVDLVPAKERTTTVLEFDPATNKVTTLPAPPFDVDALWPSDEAVGMLASKGAQIASFDGVAWTELPPLPGLVFLYRADARRVFARTTASVWLYADGTWHDLALAVGGARNAMGLGPWSSTTIRLAWIDRGATQNEACTQQVDTTSLVALGAPVCKDTLSLSKFLGDAVNGTVDDFQVVFTDDRGTALVWRFANGGWIRGALIGAGAVRATPGSKDLCVDTLTVQPGASLRTTPLVRVSGGQPVETLFVPSFPLLGCAGDERTCARNVDLVIQGVNRDCTATWFLIDNLVDARRRAYVKKVDLPSRDAVTCSPACASTELCLATSETAGVCAIDPVSNATATLMPASLVLNVGGFTGVPVLPALFFSAPDTGLPLSGFTTRVDVGTQRTFASGPPHTPVTMTVHLEGHADRAFTFTMPDENTQADLGTIFLMRGTRLGLVPAGVSRSTVLANDAGSSLVLPLADADGGVSMTQVLESSDGGVMLRPLTGSDATASVPLASPDGRWLLWTDVLGLVVLDLATLQRNTVPGTWQLPTATFSADGSTVAISHATASTSVLSLAAPPVERFVATGLGDRALQLSRDGAMLLHHPAAGWTLTTASNSFVASNADAALLSGDGSRLYTTSGSVGALTLSVQPATAGAASTQVATGVRAVTIDPAGSDALFDSFSSGATTVWRVSGSTASVVQAGIQGQAEALTAGALWVRDATSTTVFFPFATASGRVFTGNHTFSFDDRNALLSAKGLSISPAGSLTLPAGPGVFSFDSTRRINPVARSISTLSGNTEVSQRGYASPNLMPAPAVDARFTGAGGRQSYFAPCALFSVPAKSFSIAPSGGAVTLIDSGTEVYCVK